ncbi:methanethiol S-methyltransferase [Flavobacterium sp. Arc2]|uniref:methanethiol S-methyltransferase n=1 Tax=Flavobacterium sp. Arc2 TaxID=3046685 RepID=UPI00352F02A0
MVTINLKLSIIKKIISFIYGALAYLLFLFTILYAIGFLSNSFVPKSIDSGTETALLPSLLIDVLLLSVFAIQHSLMARPAFKKWITAFISPVIERSTYVLFSSLALLLMYWKWQPITAIVWKADNETIAVIITGVFLFGWLVALLSTFMINHFDLFGLKQIFDNLKDKIAPSSEFQTNYLYKIVRHPIMLGYVIAFWATPVMTVGHLLFAVTTTLYIVVAVKHLEEKDLRESIGKAYEDYENKVPMLIPFTKKG